MTVDIEKLEALAKAAKSGGAEWSDLNVDTERMYTAEGMLVELYEFATPAVLLYLIASKALAEEARDLYLADKKRLLDDLNDSRAEVAGLKTGYEAYERVNAELRAECEALRNRQSFSDAFYEVSGLLGVTGARPEAPLVVFRQEVVPALQAVIRDSRRYKWLRDSAGSADWEFFGHQQKDSTDQNIDAAMSKESAQ